MSCQLKTLISIFILSAISLNLNSRHSIATAEREAAGYSKESRFNRVFYNFTEKTSQQLQSSAFQLNSTNSDLNRSPADRSNNETLPSSKHAYELWSDDSGSLFTINENARSRSFHKRASVIEDGFQGDAPGEISFFKMM